MSEVAIRVHGLTRVFQTAHGPVRALDDLSLEIGRGRIFGFLGPNGAGKTTTFRLLLGLIEPTAGSALVLGHDAATDGAGVRARAGALLEHDGLYERLTAQENLEYYGRIWRLRASERADRIRELLQRFGLWDRRDDPIGTWSRGMKRKLALSRALLHRPELILLDEPTAGLDPGAAATLRDDLAGLSAHEHATIFINTHNLSEAEVLCDTVGVIAGGRLRACGSPHSLRSEFESHHVEISGRRFDPAWTPALSGMAGIASVTVRDTRITAHAAPTTSLAPLVRFLVEQGAEIEEVRRDHATLEDVYLQLTGAAA